MFFSGMFFSGKEVPQNQIQLGRSGRLIPTEDLMHIQERMSDQKSDAFNYPMNRVLARYQTDCGVSAQQSALHERELKRYLFLCAENPGAHWPMVNTIDDLWHTFLLFTQDYHAFCAQLGVPFIHHEPFLDGEVHETLADDYRRFLDIYRSNFGDPPTEIWPQSLCTDHSDCGSGCSGGGCSGIGCGATCGSSCR